MNIWNFSDHEASILLGMEDAKIIGDLYRGFVTLRQRDQNDRLRAVLSIAADLDALYRDENVIRSWLRERQEMLDGNSPLSFLLEGSMEKLLWVRQYVDYLAGR